MPTAAEIACAFVTICPYSGAVGEAELFHLGGFEKIEDSSMLPTRDMPSSWNFPIPNKGC